MSRKLLQDVISGFGSGDIGPSVQTSDGVSHTCKRIQRKIIKTLYGKIEIHRMGYYKKGGTCVYPLDAFFNLPLTSFSYDLQRRMVFEGTRGSFGEASTAIFETHKIKVYKQQIEEVAISASQDFDEYYNSQVTLKNLKQEKTNPILVLSLDAKGIVMRKEDLTEATRKAPDGSEHKIKHRLAKP